VSLVHGLRKHVLEDTEKDLAHPPRFILRKSTSQTPFKSGLNGERPDPRRLRQEKVELTRREGQTGEFPGLG